MIHISHKGSFAKTEKFLRTHRDFRSLAENAGKRGVFALANATPKDTGETASSWGYEVKTNSMGFSIVWTNSWTENGCHIAVIIQYGHGTRNGGYVQGLDYINPAIQPIFEEIAKSLWEEVTKS